MPTMGTDQPSPVDAAVVWWVVHSGSAYSSHMSEE